jgi:phosphoglycerate kinase
MCVFFYFSNSSKRAIKVLSNKQTKIELMKTLTDFDFKNKKAIIRVDFNVPLDENLNVTDAELKRQNLQSMLS